ncbi:uncharacterized protein LOC110720206 [Chenopodium quinoa]|uniref:uncharacterized protein LOC110720206 n=1 Tax=Chenopodium quinoa TaxID=63459 RepID=UPI000B78DC59|nr:uncharacterized protein LOC110720206 [Chenopodium quinoa]
MELWNKVVVCKLLWAISCKKDKLWVRWVDAYYIRGRNLDDVHCQAMSWALKKIFDYMNLIKNAGGWDSFIKGGCFSIKTMYKFLHGIHDKVSWSRVICNNQASPRSLFIAWLAICNRLPTLDRLSAWGITSDTMCKLCGNVAESIDHLFFKCTFSAQIWGAVLQILHCQRNPGSFDSELLWATKCGKKGTPKHKLFLMFFAEIIYAIWIQRNEVVFNQYHRSADALMREISFKVASRCNDRQCEILIVK